MSIELSNGVVLPDLPTEVLAECPYVVIAEFMDATVYGDGTFTLAPVENTYLLCAATEAFFYAAKESLSYDFGMTSSQTAATGTCLKVTVGETDWGEATGYMLGTNAPGDDVLQWANHDVCYVTFSENGDPVFSTEVYFANSERGTVDPEPTIPEIMSVTGEWLVSMAGHTRRLSGTSDKFTPEEMDEFYAALVIPEADEVTLQEKSVEPSTEAQEVVPDAGYDGLSKVTVDAARLEEKSVELEFSSHNLDWPQVIEPSDGYYGIGKVLVPNVKLETQARGIAGPLRIGEKVTLTFTPNEGYDGISSATATFTFTGGDPMTSSLTVLPSEEPQTFIANNEWGYYSMVSVGPARLEEKEVTPTAEDQVIQASEGFYGLGKVTVLAAADSPAPVLDELRVTPTAQEQTFTPTAPTVGYSKVVVAAAESGGGGVEYPNVMEASF